jgi:hypothetical protein
MQLFSQRTHPGGHLPRTVAHQHDRGCGFGGVMAANLAEGLRRLSSEPKVRTLAGLVFLGINPAQVQRINLTRARTPIS